MKQISRLLLATLLLAGFLFLWQKQPELLRAQTAPTPSPQTAVDPRFGAIESFWAAEEAAELDVGWERILFYWSEIQPKDVDDWNTLHVLEEWLAEAQAQDRIVVGLLKNTPQWATDGDTFSGVPRGLELPIDDPDNLWATYVRRIAEYYSVRGVHHWIIWNEPEIDKGVYGHEFDGDVADYYRLLKVAYLVMKEVDPTATIHLAGYSYWHDPGFLNEFFKVVKADPEAEANNYFFDVLSLHIYFRVETVRSLVQQVDAIQQFYGIDKPIWINETNASPNLDPWWPVERPLFQIDLDQQAWYIIQAHALGFGAGADSIGVYKLVDLFLGEGGESFGILRPDFSKRPAYIAYQTTIERLSGFLPPAQTQRHSKYFMTTFERPQDITRILWARNAEALTVKIPAFGEAGTLVDYLGNETSILPEDGFYLIKLDGARCRGECLIGGAPLFLVEEDGVMPERLLGLSYPALLQTATATPETTATFTPWPTNTSAPTETPTSTPTPTVTPTILPSDTPTPTSTQTQTQTPLPPATATSLPSASPQPTPLPTVEPESNSPVLGWGFLGIGLLFVLFIGGLAWRRRSTNE